MSQRKTRQTTEEVMAARENLEARIADAPIGEITSDRIACSSFDPRSINTNVIDFPTATDAAAAAEIEQTPAFKELEKVLDKTFNTDEKPADSFDLLPSTAVAVQAECPYCGKQMILENISTSADLYQEAAMRCDCPEAKADQQGNTINKKIDMIFGKGSTTYGFPDELNDEERDLIKLFAHYVIEGEIKAVIIVMNNNERATIQTVKDAIKVRRNKATRAEAEA